MELIADIVDLNDNSFKMKKKPKQTHSLQEIRRGRGTSETFHAMQGSFTLPARAL
jgi:hypothetical protein